MRLLAAAMLLALSYGGALQAGAKNYNDPELERLILEQQKGEVLNRMAETRRDGTIRRLDADKKAGKINSTQYDIEVSKAHDTYGKTSQRLTRRYRAPVVERLQKILPELRDSLGTGFYKKKWDGSFETDASGRKIINSKHRGWRGDFDFKGSQKTLNEFSNTMAANGAKLEVSARSDGSKLSSGVTQKSVKSLEFTVNSETIQDGARSSLQGAKDRLHGLVNEKIDLQSKIKSATGTQKANLQRQLDVVQKDLKSAQTKYAVREKILERVSRKGFSDSLNTPGSSAHSDLQAIRANDVETFVSASMKNGQVFQQSVEVEDHIKKASKGLAATPAELHGNSDLAKEKFQGMTKGTQKAIRAVGMTDVELNAILKKNNFPGDAAAYKAELQLYRDNKKFASSGTQADVARLQDISKEVLVASREKATRMDTARLKKIEKSMGGMSPEARTVVQTDIVDGQERLRASREANLTRSKKGGFDLGKAPDIPASSDTPSGGWFLRGMGIDPGSRLGRFFGDPPAGSKIMKYGGPAAGALGIFMLKSIVDSKVSEVADDKGLVLPIMKLTGKTLAELADFAGVSAAEFSRGMDGDLKSAKKKLKDWGFENSIFNTPAMVLAAGFSPVKSLVKGVGGQVYQFGANSVEMANLMATMPPAMLEAWRKQSDVEKRLLTDKVFRQASILADRRVNLPKLELDRTIALLQAGLKPDQVESNAAIREYLVSGLEADTVSDEAAIRRLEAKIGKMSPEEKGAFLKKREERRQVQVNSPLAQLEKAAQAQDSLNARLIAIETELGKGRGYHSVDELKALQAELEGINKEFKLFKGIEERMSAADREKIRNQDGTALGDDRTSVVGAVELKMLQDHRELLKNFDKMQRRIESGLGPRGLGILIYDAKENAKRAENGEGAQPPVKNGPTLEDMLAQIGDPAKLALDNLQEVLATGLDVASVISTLTSTQEIDAAEHDLDGALSDLKDKSDLAVEKQKAARDEVAQKAASDVKTATAAAKAQAQKQAQKQAKRKTQQTSKPARQQPAPAASFSGSYTGSMTGSNSDGVRVQNGRFTFSIKGNKVSGEVNGKLVFASLVNVFHGTVAGSFDPSTSKLDARLTGRWSGGGGSGDVNGVIRGKRTRTGFSGKWAGGGVSGSWQTTGGGADVQESSGGGSWDEHMCTSGEELRAAFIRMGGTCK